MKALKSIGAVLCVLGVSTVTEAGTTSFTYQCSMVGVGSRAEPMRLRISTRSATVKVGAGDSQSYTFDPGYTPRGNSTDLRYRASADRWILVQKTLPKGGYALRTGGHGGYAKLEVRVDGFSSWRYICRR